MNPDQLKALARTVWPGFVAYLTALIATWAGAKLGVQVDTNVTFGAVSLGLLGIVYLGGRWLEGRTSPVARKLGHWLISLGLDLGQPTYDGKEPQVRPVVVPEPRLPRHRE